MKTQSWLPLVRLHARWWHKQCPKSTDPAGTAWLGRLLQQIWSFKSIHASCSITEANLQSCLERTLEAWRRLRCPEPVNTSGWRISLIDFDWIKCIVHECATGRGSFAKTWEILQHGAAASTSEWILAAVWQPNAYDMRPVYFTFTFRKNILQASLRTRNCGIKKGRLVEKFSAKSWKIGTEKGREGPNESW